LAWPGFLGGKKFPWPDRQRTIGAIVILTCVMVWIYVLTVVPYRQKREKVRTMAAQIDALVPASERLFAVDPNYQPFLFYVRGPVSYANAVADLPGNARFFLVRPERVEEAEKSERWSPWHARPVREFKDYRDWKVILFEIKPGS
jgi:hypothetical protein